MIRAKSSLFSRKQGTQENAQGSAVKGSTMEQYPNICSRNGHRIFKSQEKYPVYQGQMRQRNKRINVSDFPQTPLSKKRPMRSYKQLSPAEIKRQEEEGRIQALGREEQKKHDEMVAFVEEHCKLQRRNGVKVHLADADVSYLDTGARCRDMN